MKIRPENLIFKMPPADACNLENLWNSSFISIKIPLLTSRDTKKTESLFYPDLQESTETAFQRFYSRFGCNFQKKRIGKLGFQELHLDPRDSPDSHWPGSGGEKNRRAVRFRLEIFLFRRTTRRILQKRGILAGYGVSGAAMTRWKKRSKYPWRPFSRLSEVFAPSKTSLSAPWYTSLSSSLFAVCLSVSLTILVFVL